jgi:Resolvase, N terminal domain
MIVLYARVSTTDQTTAHQLTQAQAVGFKIDKVVADEGISGVGTRLAERSDGKRLFDMLRAGDTLVVRWVDRLGLASFAWLFVGAVGPHAWRCMFIIGVLPALMTLWVRHWEHANTRRRAVVKRKREGGTIGSGPIRGSTTHRSSRA